MERPSPKFHENLFFQLYTIFRDTPSTILIVLVADNERSTQQKRLIFRPQKPRFGCKVTPSTLHSLYVARGDPGGVRGGGKNEGATVEMLLRPHPPAHNGRHRHAVATAEESSDFLTCRRKVML